MRAHFRSALNSCTAWAKCLAVLLFTIVASCSKPPAYEEVPDQTRKVPEEELLNVEKKIKKLEDRWEALVELLPDARQRCRLRVSVLKLQESASDKMYAMVHALPDDKKRAGFLKDLVFFDKDERKRLINILVYLYDQDQVLLLNIFRNVGQVSFFTKFRFYDKERKLPPGDKALLDQLIAELKQHEEA